MLEYTKHCTKHQLEDYVDFLETRKIAPNPKNLEYFLTLEKRVVNKNLEQGSDEIVIQRE